MFDSKLKGLIRSLCLLLLVQMPLQAAYPYMNGILPTNASFEKVKEYWGHYKNKYITVSGDKAVGGHWEYHAFSMVFAAYIEDDEELFSKLWNEVEPGVEWEGPLWRKYKAADVLIDIAMGLDRAAVRWGGKWPDLAKRWILRFEHKLGPFWDICGCWDNPTGRKHNQLHCWAINGDACGHYINYYALSHFFRFDQRTDKTLWMDTVMTECFYTLEHTYTKFALPPWYVRMKDVDRDGKAEGVQVLPGDMNNSRNPDKWDGGATRSAWRLPFAYIAFGTDWSYKWAEKMYNFYKSVESDPTNLSRYRPSSGQQYGSSGGDMLAVCGAGVLAMAMEDQEWADRVWDYMVDPANKNQSNQQRDSQRLYCMLKMSGKFDVYGDAEFAPGIGGGGVGTRKTSARPLLPFQRQQTHQFIAGTGSPVSSVIADYVQARKAVAVYDLRGTFIDRAHDLGSFTRLNENLSPGKYILK